MKTTLLSFLGMCIFLASSSGENREETVTVYNQGFGVVRDWLELDLKKGINQIEFSDTTAHLESNSVILRDPTAKHQFQILEQNYHADPISQELLLSLNEGKTIDFLVQTQNQTHVVQGKIIRSAYVPHRSAWQTYGNQYIATQSMYVAPQSGHSQPIIEVDGKLRFSLPGIPLFPSLPDDDVLKPTIQWILESPDASRFAAELIYVTGGMNWKADYNVISPEAKDIVDLVGWVTIDNQSGKTFERSKLKLLAGDVSKIQETQSFNVAGYDARGARMDPNIVAKSFDEYHVYNLEQPTTLKDRETKQIEFIHASGIQSNRIYVYDGAFIDPNRYRGYTMNSIRTERDYGTETNKKVWVMREFLNSRKNNLGMPLPKGKLRFYKRDADDHLIFIGENLIEHTPQDEKVRVYTGDAFDLVGERSRTEFNIDNSNQFVDESFEIRLRNHKSEPVEIRVVEHLYRWTNWKITKSSNAHLKTDSQTMEMRIQVPPGQEKVITYTVHYTW